MRPKLPRGWWAVAATLFAMAPAAARAADEGESAPLDLAAWQFIRASGLAAFVLLSGSMFLGVAVNVRALDSLMKRAWVNEGHQTLSLLALTFTGLHIALLLVNRHVPFSPAGVLVPFTSEWEPLPAALGSVATYLVFALVASSYVRPAIGHRTWRVVHYAGLAGWAIALVHGVSAGSDSGLLVVQYLYLVAGASVVFLVLFRVLAPSERAARAAAMANGQLGAAVRRVTTR